MQPKQNKQNKNVLFNLIKSFLGRFSLSKSSLRIEATVQTEKAFETNL